MSLTIKKAYAEVDEILKTLDEEYLKKIPINLKGFFETEKDKSHRVDIDFSLTDNGLLKETLAILALLNLKYWVNDKSEYNRLINIYKENELKSMEYVGGASY